MASLGKPFWVTVASKAPHAPFTPAPWYASGTWVDGHPGVERTASYNASAEALREHHALIANQPPISQRCAGQIDDNFRDRWRALLSVDDAVAGMVAAVEELGLWNRTYFMITSDHGYNLGQHRLPFGKHNVYDHDIRIPFVIRGPGIAPNSTFGWPGSTWMLPRPCWGWRVWTSMLP